MRFRRLSLLRYGHLSDVVLDFPEEASLCVVAGANEAGKSTALAAIADALFGFGHRTDFDFLHGGPQLRIGFALRSRDGTDGAFIRRKGRRDTLRDSDDAVVPDAVLARFLGGIGREQFETRFGLNGARLREGARDLLASGGEAGESILAGMGLLHLRTALARLDEEAKSLFGDGRGRRRLSAAIEAWRSAHNAAEDAAVTPQDWEQATDERDKAFARLAEIRDITGRLVAEASRLERFRRLRTPLAELDAARRNLAPVLDAPRLPAEAADTLRRATEARRLAQRDAEREAAEVARLSAERAALAQDAPIRALEHEIDALAERRPVVRQAAADLPGVVAQITAYRAAVAEAARDLGIADTPEGLRERVPSDGLRRRAQQMVARRATLLARQGAAAEALAQALRRRDMAAAALEKLPDTASPAPLRRAVEAARAEGPLDLEHDRAGRALAAAERATAAALSALPLWSGDAPALAACALPIAAETDAVAAGLAAAVSALAEARQEAADLGAEIDGLEEQVVVLARGETVPTRDAVAAARGQRDRAWRLIRRTVEGGAAPEPAERAGLPDLPLPDAFETLLGEADILSDRRADDAGRVAQFQAATARLEMLRPRRSAADDLLAGATVTMAQADAAWQALWAPAGVSPQSPAAMLEWRRGRSEVLRLREAEAQLSQRLEDIAARREQACAALRALLPGQDGGAGLAEWLALADAACFGAEEAVTARQRAADRLRQEEERLPELRHAADNSAAAFEASEGEWAAAVASLGLERDSSAADVETALAAWTRIAEAAEAWRSDAHRIARMDGEIARFAEATRALLERLAEPPAEGQADVVFGRLAARLAASRKAHGDAEALSHRIAGHEAGLAEARRAMEGAEQELAALRQRAGAEDDAALEEAIARAQRRDALVATIERIEGQVLELGDGLGEAALRAEASGIDADTAPLRLAEIAAEQTALGDERDRLGQARAEAEARLARMQAGSDAAGRAQEAENALAEAREAAGRYARVHLARTLLRAGIERFRAERQGPLLRAAGGHFALLTSGRYARLSVDEDAAGRSILLAVRGDGVECPVEALSEGTRDQLYLALRIAVVEAHAAEAEPLPFIADDLLVQFDDARAGAALELLSRLGHATQVILFTHHDHIADLAGRQRGVAVLRMPGIS